MGNVQSASRRRIIAAIAVGLLALGFFMRGVWLPWLLPEREVETKESESSLPPNRTFVSEQAQKNLGLIAKPLAVDSFWKKIRVPGMIVDRPTQSDRFVTAPLAGVVSTIGHVPGDTVQPGDELFKLRILSESLHQTQSELFKATQEIEFARAQRERLAAAGESISKAMLIEANNQIARLEAAAKAFRQELLNRGLSLQQIDRVAQGNFESEIPIVVPITAASKNDTSTTLISPAGEVTDSGQSLELQELKVDVGQQVQAGQTLCLLSNHRKLAIQGSAFRDETPILEQSLKEKWPVDIDFQEESSTLWPQFKQTLHIEHLASVIDPVNRTFSFLIPLDNESRTVEQNDRTRTLWRFRPGQKVGILVKVEQLKNVFVLPAEAVAREGAEAFVFTQNVNMFDRKPVHVLLHDRRHVVIANDGALLPGMFVAQAAAAQLNRMVKSQTSSVPKGYHIHADGSLHKNEDEGK